MGRIAAAVRALDAQRVGVVVAGDEIIEAARRTGIARAGIERAMTAAIQAYFAAIVEQSGLGLDVDDAGGAIAIFRRQGAIDQAHGLREARIQGLAEDGNAFRQDDPVDAVLQAVMLAADMELAEGILGHA